MEFLFLGPLLVRSDDSEVTISAPRQRVVLSTLLLSPNKVVPVDRIARFVWDPLPPSAAATVRTYVMRLRQVLGGAGAERILTRAPGYLLQAAEDETDLGRFHAHRRAAKRLAERDDLPGAVAELDQGLGLWRNDPFLDVPSPRLRDSEGVHLRELRLQALGWRMDMQLSLQRHAELLPELRQIVCDQPFNEAFVGRLMLALARAGQQPEALELYQRTRADLIGEFGMEPGNDLREIQGRILRAEAESAPPVAVRGGPAYPVRDEPAVPEEEMDMPLPAQLPPAVHDFTGRDPETRELAALLTSPASPAPAAVITGGPGVGKTSLLLRAAHAARGDFPDGQLYASLKDSHGRPADPADVAGRFLVGLGVPEHTVPSGGTDRLAMYRSVIARRRVLVVLDDFTSRSQLGPLMPGSGDSRILVSSRSHLVDVDWSRTIQLAALDDDESLGLLAGIIGREQTEAAPEAVRWIVHACSGMPLALRVAGLRLAHRTLRRLDALARRLADPQRILDELQFGELAVRTALDRAYDDLATHRRNGTDLRLVLRRLGMISPRCIRPPTVGALLECTPEHAEGLLDDLVDAHLLRAGDGGCYQMPWLIWVHARERMYREELSGYYIAAVERLTRYRRTMPEPNCHSCPTQPWIAGAVALAEHRI